MGLRGLKTTAVAMTGVLTFAVMAESVSAQTRGARRPAQATKAAAPALDRTRGAAEAPAVVQAAGLNCTVADAAYLGSTAEGRSTYEVACREGLGFIVSSAPKAGGQAMGFDCIAAQATAQAAQTRGETAVQCRLPGNAQPMRGLQPLVASAGITCTVNNARYLGETSTTRATRYEIGCAEGAGYVIDRLPGGAKPTATSCFRASVGGSFQCQYTTQAQNFATFQPAVAQSGRTCTVANVRPVGRNPRTSNEVYEVGCAPGQVGFLLETANGAFAQAYDCGRFGNVACQFTAAEQAQAYTTESLTGRLRAAAFDCTVSNFRRLGIETSTGREAVEVACSNRPDGVIAVVPAGNTGRLDTYDCLFSAQIGQSCTLTQVSSFYPKLGAAVAAAQRANCTVTNTRLMGATSQGGVLHEVACAEGRNAIIDYRGKGRVQDVIRCINATDLFGGCKLPVAARR